MQATANGRNPYFEGQYPAEDAEDTANRLALVAERDALAAENKRLRYENEFMLRLVNEREQAT